MYTLKFHPILKSMIWGGDKLCQYKTIDTDQKNIGESWELSGVPGNESVVSNGEFAVGPSLNPLMNMAQTGSAVGFMKPMEINFLF